MKSLLRLMLAAGVFVATAGILPHAWQSTAKACPSCKNANETETRKPTAYMYSILFMLGMPATIFSCFGVAFYRMSRREMLLQHEMMPDPDDVVNT
jgi:hypothetical protein